MRTLHLCFCLLILGTCVRAQPSGAAAKRTLTLDEAITEALANNYQIRIADARLAESRNNVDPALTGRRPTVSVGINPGVSYRNNANPASIVAQSETFSYGIGPAANLSWTLYNGGRIDLTEQRLETLATLDAEQRQQQVENTVADVTDAYYNAVVQREQAEVRRRVLKLSRDRIRYQEVRAEYGQGGTFNELQARDAFLSDSTSLVVQRLQYDLALRSLLQLMGADDLDRRPRLTTELAEATTDFDRATLEQRLLEDNSQLATLRVSQQLAAIGTRTIETERRPTVTLNAGVAYDYNLATGTQTFVFGDAPPDERALPGIGATTLSAQLGFGVNYLLYDGGSRSVRAQTARLAEQTAALNLDAAAQQLRTALATTLDRYATQRRVVALTRETIANAERNLEIASERFRGGTINSFDYRQIQLSYVNAEFQLLSALLNLQQTETEILRLVGRPN